MLVFARVRSYAGVRADANSCREAGKLVDLTCECAGTRTVRTYQQADNGGEMAELDGEPRSGRRDPRIAGVALAVVLALCAAGLAYVNDVDLPVVGSGDDPSYCWGAWEHERAPWHESADVMVEDDSRPTAERPSGECSFLFSYGRGAGLEPEDPPDYVGGVTVTYDRPPEKQDDRLAWLTKYFDGTSAPLPDGLPGFVSAKRGIVVLPPRCDEDNEPTVVTLTTKTRSGSNKSLPSEYGSSVKHTRSELSRLLLSAAQKGIEHAGCTEPDGSADDDAENADWREDSEERAKHERTDRRDLDTFYDDKRYRGEDGYDPDEARDEPAFPTDAPVLGDPDDKKLGTQEALCHLAGMPNADAVLGSPGNRNEWVAGLGVPGAPNHLCSYRADLAEFDVATDSDGLDRERTDGVSLTATSDPRLLKLLLTATQRDDNEELPGWDSSTYAAKDLAVARAGCRVDSADPKDTLFVVARSHPTKQTPAQVLPAYVKAVEGHMGCEGVAPSD